MTAHKTVLDNEKMRTVKISFTIISIYKYEGQI